MGLPISLDRGDKSNNDLVEFIGELDGHTVIDDA